ncbi:uncharacterized protein LOC116843976 [Odontomachus brunneus]|uniref:uncharacterized protein LOC116843976 n=1 Tax=Odontomachus brunneus TaxID=486640 RepID=UPI0013F21062|nr:uncharacterized protein LOC116843976 [Odontomachus brunneus]
MKLVIFALLVITAMAMAAPQGEKATCSKLYEWCQTTDNCCPNSICLSYAAKCVPKSGIIVPASDASEHWDGNWQ